MADKKKQKLTSDFEEIMKQVNPNITFVDVTDKVESIPSPSEESMREKKLTADMMICPKAGKCKPVGYCDGKEPHKRMDGCKQWYCPITGETMACIPSPSPEPVCPVCGHPVSEHRDGRSGYKGCYHNRINNVPLYCECECSPTDLIPSPSEPDPQPEPRSEERSCRERV